MAMTENGLTTTRKPGQFQWEIIRRGNSVRIIWEYRQHNGALAHGVAMSLDAAIKAAREYGYKEGRE